MRIRAILLAVATATALSLLPSSSGAAEAAVYTASGHISVTPKSIENPGSFEVKAVVAKASSITTSPFLPKQAKIVANGVLTLAPPPLTHQNSPIVGTGIFTLTSSDGHTSLPSSEGLQAVRGSTSSWRKVSVTSSLVYEAPYQ